MSSLPVDQQVRLYRGLLSQFGRGAGAAMWDEVVRPFVARLAGAGRWTEEREALKSAREALGVVFGSQMDTEMREPDAKLLELGRTAGAAR